MSGLRLTVVDGGPCRLEKSKIVAFAPETVSIPTTMASSNTLSMALFSGTPASTILLRILKKEKNIGGRQYGMLLARKGSLASTQLTSNSKSLVSRPMTSATSS